MIEVFLKRLQTAGSVLIKFVSYHDLELQSIKEEKFRMKNTKEIASEFYKAILKIPKEEKIEEKLLEYRIESDGLMSNV